MCPVDSSMIAIPGKWENALDTSSFGLGLDSNRFQYPGILKRRIMLKTTKMKLLHAPFAHIFKKSRSFKVCAKIIFRCALVRDSIQTR